MIDSEMKAQVLASSEKNVDEENAEKRDENQNDLQKIQIVEVVSLAPRTAYNDLSESQYSELKAAALVSKTYVKVNPLPIPATYFESTKESSSSELKAGKLIEENDSDSSSSVFRKFSQSWKNVPPAVMALIKPFDHNMNDSNLNETGSSGLTSSNGNSGKKIQGRVFRRKSIQYHCRVCPYYRTGRKSVIVKHVQKLHNKKTCLETGFLGSWENFPVEMADFDAQMDRLHDLRVAECYGQKLLIEMDVFDFSGVRYHCDCCNFSCTKEEDIRSHLLAEHGINKDWNQKRVCCKDTDQHSDADRPRDIATEKPQRSEGIEQISESNNQEDSFSVKEKKNGLQTGKDTDKDSQPFVPKRKSRYQRTLKCEQCIFTTRYKWDLKIHEKVEHSGSKGVEKLGLAELKYGRFEGIRLDGIELYKCPQCSFVTSRKQGHLLAEHVSNMHGQGLLLKCTKCNYSANWRSSFHHHVKKAHKDFTTAECLDLIDNSTTRTETKGEKILRVPATESDDVMNTHDQEVSETRSLSNFARQRPLKKCKECPYTTSWKYDLEIHNREAHRDRDGLEINTPLITEYGIMQRLKVDGRDFYRCPKCRFVSPTINNTQAHYIQVHH